MEETGAAPEETTSGGAGSATSLSGAIKGLGMLDLTNASEEDIAAIESLEGIGTIVVRKGMAGLLGRRPIVGVGSIIPVDDDARVDLISGQVKLDGEAFNGDEAEDRVLVISGQAIVTSPIKRVQHRRIALSGQLLVPDESVDITSVLGGVSGQVDTYPWTEGMEIRVEAGQLKLSGEALANREGSEHDILLLTGQLVITSPVEQVGYRQVMVTGQAVLPKQSEDLLAPRLRTTGQLIYYRSDSPRFFIDDDAFAAAFFEFLPAPIELVLVGSFTIEDDVSSDLLREKVTGIALAGSLVAPGRLVPLLQVLAEERAGSISASDGDAAQ